MQSPSKNKHKGLIVAGMHSSGGKTAVTSLLLAALRKRKFAVQPFKVGPDYIDPGFHFHFSAIQSINLDPWIMGREYVVKAAQQSTENTFLPIPPDNLLLEDFVLFRAADPNDVPASAVQLFQVRLPILEL